MSKKVSKRAVVTTDTDSVIESKIDSWDIIGIDASLSRTGYARLNSDGDWLDIGSFAPEDSKLPVWVRSAAIANLLKQLFAPQNLILPFPDRTGLLLVLEAPTINNDFLQAIHRVMNIVFWSDKQAPYLYDSIKVLLINASTLRSKYGLTKTGNNKDENKAKAYELVNPKEWPGIDSDSCDGVLLAHVGLHCAKILMGRSEQADPKWVEALTDTNVKVKGKGRNQKIVKVGLMYNPMYWWSYQKYDVKLSFKDARVPSGKRLAKKIVSI